MQRVQPHHIIKPWIHNIIIITSSPTHTVFLKLKLIWKFLFILLFRCFEPVSILCISHLLLHVLCSIWVLLKTYLKYRNIYRFLLLRSCKRNKSNITQTHSQWPMHDKIYLNIMLKMRGCIGYVRIIKYKMFSDRFAKHYRIKNFR